MSAARPRSTTIISRLRSTPVDPGANHQPEEEVRDQVGGGGEGEVERRSRSA